MQDSCLLCDKSHHRIIYNNNSIPGKFIDERNQKKAISVLIKLLFLPENFNEYLRKSFFCYTCITKLVQLEDLYYQMEYFQGKIVQVRREIELELVSATYRDDQDYQVNKSYTKETRKIVCDLIQVKSDPENDIILNGNSMIDGSPKNFRFQESEIETPPRKMTSILSNESCTGTGTEEHYILKNASDYNGQEIQGLLDLSKLKSNSSRSLISLGLDEGYFINIFYNENHEKENYKDGSDSDLQDKITTEKSAQDQNQNIIDTNENTGFNSNSSQGLQNEIIGNQIVIEVNDANIEVDETIENCNTNTRSKAVYFEDQNIEQVDGLIKDCESSAKNHPELDTIAIDLKAKANKKKKADSKKVPIKRKCKARPMSHKSTKEQKLQKEKEATLKDLEEICVNNPLHKCFVILKRVDSDSSITLQALEKNPAETNDSLQQKNGEITTEDSNPIVDNIKKRGRGRQPRYQVDSETSSQATISTTSPSVTDSLITSKKSVISALKSRSRSNKKILNKLIEEENSSVSDISTKSKNKNPKENEKTNSNMLKKNEEKESVSQKGKVLKSSKLPTKNNSLPNEHVEKKTNESKDKNKKKNVKDSPPATLPPPTKIRKIETKKPRIVKKKQNKKAQNKIEAPVSLPDQIKDDGDGDTSKSKKLSKSGNSGKSKVIVKSRKSSTAAAHLTPLNELFSPDKITKNLPHQVPKKKAQKGNEKTELERDQQINKEPESTNSSYTELTCQNQEMSDPKKVEDSVNKEVLESMQLDDALDNSTTTSTTNNENHVVEDSNSNKNVDVESQIVENNDGSQEFYFRCPYTTCPDHFPDKLQLISHLKNHLEADDAKAAVEK